MTTEQGEYSSLVQFSKKLSQSSMTISIVWTVSGSKSLSAYPDAVPALCTPRASPLINTSVSSRENRTPKRQMRSICLLLDTDGIPPSIGRESDAACQPM